MVCVGFLFCFGVRFTYPETHKYWACHLIHLDGWHPACHESPSRCGMLASLRAAPLCPANPYSRVPGNHRSDFFPPQVSCARSRLSIGVKEYVQYPSLQASVVPVTSLGIIHSLFSVLWNSIVWMSIFWIYPSTPALAFFWIREPPLVRGSQE